MEVGLHLLGATAIEDNLADQVPETIGACHKSISISESDRFLFTM